jgi:hypothetical protein
MRHKRMRRAAKLAGYVAIYIASLVLWAVFAALKLITQGPGRTVDA